LPKYIFDRAIIVAIDKTVKHVELNSEVRFEDAARSGDLIAAKQSGRYRLS